MNTKTYWTVHNRHSDLYLAYSDSLKHLPSVHVLDTKEHKHCFSSYCDAVNARNNYANYYGYDRKRDFVITKVTVKAKKKTGNDDMFKIVAEIKPLNQLICTGNCKNNSNNKCTDCSLAGAQVTIDIDINALVNLEPNCGVWVIPPNGKTLDDAVCILKSNIQKYKIVSDFPG